MNKSEFIKSIATKAGSSVKEATSFYNGFVETVAEALKAGDKIQLVGFGSIELKHRPERMGINPQTKQQVKIAACEVPSFKFGKSFRAEFN